MVLHDSVRVVNIGWACKENEKSKKPFVYFKNYQRTFNDLNDRHLSSRQAIGYYSIEIVGGFE